MDPLPQPCEDSTATPKDAVHDTLGVLPDGSHPSTEYPPEVQPGLSGKPPPRNLEASDLKPASSSQESSPKVATPEQLEGKRWTADPEQDPSLIEEAAAQPEFTPPATPDSSAESGLPASGSKSLPSQAFPAPFAQSDQPATAEVGEAGALKPVAVLPLETGGAAARPSIKPLGLSIGGGEEPVVSAAAQEPKPAETEGEKPADVSLAATQPQQAADAGPVGGAGLPEGVAPPEEAPAPAKTSGYGDAKEVSMADESMPRVEGLGKLAGITVEGLSAVVADGGRDIGPGGSSLEGQDPRLWISSETDAKPADAWTDAAGLKQAPEAHASSPLAAPGGVVDTGDVFAPLLQLQSSGEAEHSEVEPSADFGLERCGSPVQSLSSWHHTRMPSPPASPDRKQVSRLNHEPPPLQGPPGGERGTLDLHAAQEEDAGQWQPGADGEAWDGDEASWEEDGLVVAAPSAERGPHDRLPNSRGKASSLNLHHLMYRPLKSLASSSCSDRGSGESMLTALVSTLSSDQ